MQSYKLRKTSETALFPIENELKLLRQENDRSWIVLMKKILSVVFSGIGTTMLCQDNYIPALINYIVCDVLKANCSMFLMLILQVLVAIGVFILLSIAFTKFIDWKNTANDNKKNAFERENLAEVFHKIILNNIITGKSFTKKAKIKLKEMQDCMQQYDKEDEKKEKQIKVQIRELKRELCLYLSEAAYYFVIAEKQIRDKKVIEIGSRKEYIEYLKEVGVLTLMESLLMYEKSVDELSKIFCGLFKLDKLLWQENDYEIFSIESDLEKMENIKTSILDWETNLKNTMKEINN